MKYLRWVMQCSHSLCVIFRVLLYYYCSIFSTGVVEKPI